MSTKPFDAAFDFLPERKPVGVVKLLREVFSAIADGKRAADDFETLRNRGVAPDVASRLIFERYFARH